MGEGARERAPRLAGWRGGKEGESKWRGASAGGRGQTGSRAPSCPWRLRIALGCRRSAPRRLAELQDLGNKRARCSFPPLFWLSLLLAFSSLLYLPSPRFTLPGPVASSSLMRQRQRRAQVGEGPGAIAGFSLGGGGGGGSNGGGGGRGSAKRAATELVGDLGSFLLLGSTFLSTARHCLHYFS